MHGCGEQCKLYKAGVIIILLFSIVFYLQVVVTGSFLFSLTNSPKNTKYLKMFSKVVSGQVVEIKDLIKYCENKIDEKVKKKIVTEWKI